MQFDACLILSAGFGTRMGNMGKFLAKPLWPIFEKKIIDIHIDLVNSMGINDVFINTHHCADLFKNYFNKNEDITILHESSLLGVGGGILNAIRVVKEKGGKRLLVINSDQLYFFESNLYSGENSELLNSDVVLVLMDVHKNGKYNEVVFDDKNFISVRPANKQHDYSTFSGISFFNVANFIYSKGPKDFFGELISDKIVKIIRPKNQFYYDFGGLELYLDLIFKVFFNDKEVAYLRSFLENNGHLNKNKIDRKRKTYGEVVGTNCLNFSKIKVENRPGCFSVVLDAEKSFVVERSGLYFKDHYVEISRPEYFFRS